MQQLPNSPEKADGQRSQMYWLPMTLPWLPITSPYVGDIAFYKCLDFQDYNNDNSGLLKGILDNFLDRKDKIIPKIFF